MTIADRTRRASSDRRDSWIVASLVLIVVCVSALLALAATPVAKLTVYNSASAKCEPARRRSAQQEL